jgi:hypothetical protein
MRHFLIIYNRSEGKLLACRRYSGERSGQLALSERFSAEWEHRGDPDVEAVVLAADSLEALKATHGRYFLTVAELAQRMAATLGDGSATLGS